MKEREDSTARHIRTFGDLTCAAESLYACIDVYDLYRRVSSLIESLQYTFLYVTFLRKIMLNTFKSNSNSNRSLARNWRRWSVNSMAIPKRLVVHILNNVNSTPKLTYYNYNLLVLLLVEFNEYEDIVLLERDRDPTPLIAPVDCTSAQKHFMKFKLQPEPMTIKWNSKGSLDIRKLHLTYGSNLSIDDLDVLADPFLWPELNFHVSMSIVDKLSLILTGYLYNGKFHKSIIPRASEVKEDEKNCHGKDFEVSIDNRDIKNSVASKLLTELSLKIRDHETSLGL